MVQGCLLLWFIASTVYAGNLALNRPASQSSNFVEQYYDYWYGNINKLYSAHLAVDGNANPDLGAGSCAHNGDGTSGSPNWFVVDLGQQFHIQYVAVTGRNSFSERLNNFIVGVTNDFSPPNWVVRDSYPLCGQYPTAASYSKMYLNCSANTPPGQFVIIQQPLNGPGSLTICELEVYGYAKIEDQFHGCYKNISAVYDLHDQTSLTIQGCISQCRYQNRTFASLQNGDSCFCGDKVRISTSVNNCRMNCSGDRNQYCGGLQNYAVYTVCPIGYYGPTCTARCYCADEKPCDIQTGICSNGCNKLWNGSACNLYASSRSTAATQNLGCYTDSSNRDMIGFTNDDTQQTIEKCYALCLNKGYLYSGNQYSTNCFCDISYGKMGRLTDSSCSMKCPGTSEVCGYGWTNSVYAALCPNGTYGLNCSKLCHCANNSQCSPEGKCVSNGCEPGWTGTFCNIRNCSVNNGACRGNETCTYVDMKFTTIAKCECTIGYQRLNYWDACTDIDECADPTACNNSSETCYNSIGNFACICKDGYKSDDYGEPYHCLDINECENRTVCDSNTETCLNTNGSFHCLCIPGCISTAPGTPYHCLDINECDNQTICDVATEKCLNSIGSFACSCLAGYQSEAPGIPYHCHDTDECSSNNGGCDNETMNCTNTIGSRICNCRSGYTKINDLICSYQRYTISPNSQSAQNPPNDGGKIAGAVVGSLIIVAIIVVVVILFVLWKRKKYRKEPARNEDPSEYNKIDISFVALPTSCIPIEHLKSYVGESQNEIEKQYQEIPPQTEESCSCGSDVELKPKNRFKNVIPYDSNRVLLQIIDGQELSHYINASYITNYNSNFKDVIAAQGPNDHTVPDFWRMICEQNVSVIVMITDLYENGKQKCSRYWPESKQESFGDITVTLTEVKTWPRFVIRHLKVVTENVDKEVIQLQYLKWPDHGVPDNVGSFLNFRRKARASMSPDTRTVVHCSAGIGRTGVFIAVDYLLEQAKAEKCVDVKECLKTLRDQRPQMIQTVKQYKFVYTALVTDLSLGDTTIPLDNFRDKVEELQASPTSGMCQLERQFEILTEGSRDRTVSLADKFLVKLSKSEIDAVYLSNFRRPDAFVVGQMPPNINLEDFLKLCTNDSKFLVYVDDLPEERLSFLPSNGNATHNLNGSKVSICEKRKDEFGTPYSIKVEKDEEDLYANAAESENNIYANTSSQTSDLTLLHVTTIQKNTIGCDAVTSVSKRIETVLNDENYKGIPVLSRSGHDLAAFLVAGNNILEMARLHNEVDIFQIVYEMKRVQPTFIPTYESYKELHDFVGEYLSGVSYDTINQKAYHSGFGHRSIFPGEGEEMYANVQANGINLC